MDTASCSTAPQIWLTNEISPMKMFDPMLSTMATPMGMSRMPMMRMSLSREDIISLLPTVTSFLASRVRRAA